MRKTANLPFFFLLFYCKEPFRINMSAKLKQQKEMNLQQKQSHILYRAIRKMMMILKRE